MIKEKNIEITVSSATYKIYYEKYGPYNKGDVICVDINDISKNSRLKVTAICELCQSENKIYYQNYNIQIERGGFYCCKNCSISKIKVTNKKKYGVEHVLQNKNVIEKGILTLKEKYGVDNISKLSEVKESRRIKMKNSNYQEKLKYGVLNKYGVDNVSKSNDIKEKKKKTCLLNFGVENPSQSSELFERAQISGKKINNHLCGLKYRGTYEKHFLDMCYENEILVEKGPTIKYHHMDKIKYYHSDFYLPKFNLICEIKSTYYYNLFHEKNICKKNYSEEIGYNFIFIIDKNYQDILNILKKWK